MHEFRVLDLSNGVEEPQQVVVKAASPEHAAKIALGTDLVRSGAKRDLRARVYFQHSGQSLSMVRLYTKVDDRRLSGATASRGRPARNEQETAE
jgi:hypothetical protein